MILPAIIPKSLADLKEKLRLVSFAKHVHIDMVDQSFNNNVSWPYFDGSKISEAAGLTSLQAIEVDLMVANPIEVGKEWLEIGAAALIFHIENLQGAEELIELKAKHQFSLGFAVSNDTPLDHLNIYVPHADFIQLMGISKIGTQGQPFDSRVLERMATVRRLYPKLAISVDGGVNLETISNLKDVGADRFVAGSAIINSAEPEVAYEKLLKIIA
jgi:ribulose-phosphate 3-epimerase